MARHRRLKVKNKGNNSGCILASTLRASETVESAANDSFANVGIDRSYSRGRTNKNVNGVKKQIDCEKSPDDTETSENGETDAQRGHSLLWGVTLLAKVKPKRIGKVLYSACLPEVWCHTKMA